MGSAKPGILARRANASEIASAPLARGAPTGVVCALERQELDFSSLPTSASTGRVPLVQSIPVARYTSLVAALRVHSLTIPSGASIRVEVVAVAPTKEDPAQDFVGPVVACFEVLSSTTAPSLQVSPSAARLGTHVSIYVTGTRGSTAGTLKAMVSLAFRPIEGGTAWTPARLGSKLTCWLDERDQVVVSGAVSSWGDQSSGGVADFSQGTAANRPSASGRVNQLAAPDFDGTNDSLLCAVNANSLWSTSAAHALVVVDTAGETLPADQGSVWQEANILYVNGAGYLGLGWTTSGPRAYAYDGVAFRTTARITGLALGAHLFELSLASGVLSLRVDGGTPVTAGSVGALSSSSVPIMGSGHLGATFFPGRIAAVLTCNAALDANELDAARKYLSSTYGVPA